MNFNNLDLVNDMYTKISDIKLKSDIATNMKYNNTDLLLNDNLNDNLNNNLNNNLVPNSAYSNNISTDIITSSVSNNVPFKSDLDYLLYNEKTKTSPKKIYKKKETKNLSNFNFKLYIGMFILFYILNSYYIINILNLQKITYNTSLVFRGLVFITIYYLLLSLL